MAELDWVTHIHSGFVVRVKVLYMVMGYNVNIAKKIKTVALEPGKNLKSG